MCLGHLAKIDKERLACLLDGQSTHVLYTVITGNYERVNELRGSPSNSERALLFTDSAKLNCKTFKQIKISESEDSVQMSRFIKMKIPCLADYGKELCYKDNSVSLKDDIAKTIQEFLGEHDLVFLEHYKRKWLLGEFIACEVYYKDSAQALRSYFLKVLKDDFRLLFKKPMWGGLFFVRVTPDTREFFRLWYSEYRSGPKRDQLSLVVALQKSGIKFKSVRVSNSESDWHIWPVELGRTGSAKSYFLRLRRKAKHAFRFTILTPWYFWSTAYYFASKKLA